METLFDNEGLSHIGLNIFTNLDPISLAHCRLVCRSWCMLVTRSRVWWSSKLSQFELKTKTTERIEGENGYYVLMPRNQRRWNYWKKAIKHFTEKENLEYLERFTLFLLREVPFAKDKTRGNIKPKDHLAYETEALTMIDKLWEDGDHKLAKKILLSYYKVPDYTKPLILAVQEGLLNLVHLFVPELISIGINLDIPLPNIADLKSLKIRMGNAYDAHAYDAYAYDVPIIGLLARSSRREQIIEMLKYFLGLGLDINVRDQDGNTFLDWLFVMQKYHCTDRYFYLKASDPKSDIEAKIEDELFHFILLQETFDINGIESLSIPIATCSNDEWIQALLQRKNFTINWRHVNQACRRGRLNMVKMLLHLDATLIHSRDPTNGASLLHTVIRACMTCRQLPPQEQEGLEELLEFLLTKIDVNITDNFGATPLHYYCRYFPEYVSPYLGIDPGSLLQLLLKQPNINVNATMTYKRDWHFRDNLIRETPLGLTTPLHICCDMDTKTSSRIAMLLLQRNDVNLHAVNEDGKTPMDVAKAGEKFSMNWSLEEPSVRYDCSNGANHDLVFLLEEAEFIRNFNNLADLFE